MITDRDMMAEGLETVEWAIDYLKVSRSHIWNMMRQGKLPSVMVGDCRRLPVAGVKDYLATKMYQSKV